MKLIKMELLDETLKKIRPVNRIAEQECEEYMKRLLKIPGSLGKLELIAAQIAGITGKIKGNECKKRVIIAMCADNGIYEEGVSSSPLEITPYLTGAMANGTGGMSTMASEAGADTMIVDIGLNGEDYPGTVNRKVANGTKNSTKGPAMTREECVQAIETGIAIVKEKKAEGYQLLGTGELGMGNTATSAAVTAVLLGRSAKETTGMGSGLTKEQYRIKTEAIEKSIRVNKPDKEDGIDVLAKVGGLDIAGLTGIYLGAAAERLPVVIDGYISATAALAAVRIAKDSRDYMIASHISEEEGYRRISEELELKPFLDLNMRLGEGSGCPLAFHVIDCALAMVNHMVKHPMYQEKKELLFEL